MVAVYSIRNITIIFCTTVLTSILILHGVSGKTRICYFFVGCFTVGEPWRDQYRPIPAPEDPEFLNTRLNYFSQTVLEKPIKVDVFPLADLNDAPFDPNKAYTVFIFPGLMAKAIQPWMRDLKDVLLKRHDYNVFLVDAEGAVRDFDYFRAVSNIRVVGRQIADFIKYLVTKGQTLDTVYLIGYDIGAHMAGYVGKHFNGTIGRITGLDPIQWLFEDVAEEVRLVKRDAIFVDIIHTDSRPPFPDLGYGIMNPVGHIDFYVNGGHGQPHCVDGEAPEVKMISLRYDDIIQYLAKFFLKRILCAHHRSITVFVESIYNPYCTFWGHNATIQNFMRGVSMPNTSPMISGFVALEDPCTLKTCAPLGLKAPKSKLRGVFIVTTRQEPPFCRPTDEITPAFYQGKPIFEVFKKMAKGYNELKADDKALGSSNDKLKEKVRIGFLSGTFS